MALILNSLVVYGENKEPVSIKFNDTNTVIQGPSDTGKSYIVDCLYFCMNGTDIPRDIGVSAGYTKFILNFLIKSEKFSIIRDYSFKVERIYKGYHQNIPINNENFIDEKVNDFLIKKMNLENKSILTKVGSRSNITLSALKSLSFFDENRTLSTDYFIGSKRAMDLTKRKSTLAFSLLGRDDSDLILPPTTDEKNQLTGKISVYEAEIQSIDNFLLDNNIEEQDNDTDSLNERLKITDLQLNQLKNINISNKSEINILNRELNSLRYNKESINNNLNNLKDSLSSFLILNQKYDSDLERLAASLNSYKVIESYEDIKCPVCSSTLPELDKKSDLFKAVNIEYNTIISLKEQLMVSINSISNEIEDTYNNIKNIDVKIDKNLNTQSSIKENFDDELFDELIDKKSILKNLVYFINKKNSLSELLISAKNRKVEKPKINRDLSSQYSSISDICLSLLKEWGLDPKLQIYVDNTSMDLKINHRERISYGKGKRAIYLTAYAIAIMQYALNQNYPHLGFLIIDSPLVTHKDPKNKKDESEDAYIQQSVADKFYIWLSKNQHKGQIIVIENDMPPEDIQNKINYIEFSGTTNYGRYGFY